MQKNVMKSMNSSKNKMNNEIILIFHFNPNAHVVSFLNLSIPLRIRSPNK